MKLIPTKVVDIVKQGGGSYYLLVPVKLFKKHGLKEGDSFICYETENGISYERVRSPGQIEQEIVVTAE